MGEDKTTTDTHAENKTNPYGPAQGSVNDLISRISGRIPNAAVTGAETGALDSLAARAKDGNPWAGNIGALTNDLFSGGVDRTPFVMDNYNKMVASLSPVASTDYTDPTKNPGMKSWLDSVVNDVTNTVNSQAASMGRTGSPGQAGALARGVVAGTAPIYGAMESNRLGAIRDMFSGGASTAGQLSGLDQTALANRNAGIGTANQALAARDAGDNATLAIEATRRGLPLQNLGALSQLIMPMASAWGTSTTDQHSTQTKESNPTNAIIGGALGGLSLLGGNPMPLLGMGASMLSGAPTNGASAIPGPGGNYFPQNPYTAGASVGYQSGYGNYPVFR